MNDSYVLMEDKLALGLEPLDALRRGRAAHPVRVDMEGKSPWKARSPDAPYARGRGSDRWIRAYSEKHHRFPSGTESFFDRHDTCLYAFLYRPNTGAFVDIRIYDHYRRYVPRRLRIPLLAEGDADDHPPSHRVRRPVLFPGAAYDVSSRVTGMRGRVLRGGNPLRWAWVEAFLPGTDIRVGVARGDDRGEFLLILQAGAQPFSALSDPVEIDLAISGPIAPPVPDPLETDPFWDLPLESVPAQGLPDGVSAGDTFPVDYVTFLSVSGAFSIPLGRILTGVDDFIVT